MRENTTKGRRRWRMAGRAGLIVTLIIVSGSVWVLGRAFRREQATHDLVASVFKNDTPAALAALRAGADPNTRQRLNDVSLSVTQLVRQLWRQMRGDRTEASADPNHRPALIALAAAKNNKAIVEALLDSRAKPDAYVHYAEDDEVDEGDVTMGETALMWAAEHNNVGMTKALLNKGADPNFTGTHLGEAPLLQTKDPEVMEDLLTHGADVHIEEKHSKFAGMTPLRYTVLNFADDGEDRNAQERRRFYRCVEVLLAHGADINENNGRHKGEEESGYDITAIQIVAQHGQPADVRFLLAKGANPHLRNWTGRDALGHALDDAVTENIKVLLAYGMNPNERDIGGRTPLFHAVEQGEDEPVRVLIAAGAKVNVKDKRGKTPLQLAEEDEDGGNDSVEDILRAAGAKDY